MKKIIYLSIAMILMASIQSFGQVPKTLNYQGFLTENDIPVTTPRNITLTLLHGSVIKHTETFTGQAVDKGLFTVTLGKVPGNELANDFETWKNELTIEIKVNNAPIGNPVPLTTVPYAFMAANVDNIHVQDLADGVLSGSKVGTGINAVNITTGIISDAVLDDDLDDLVDGSLSGSKVGTGISATNVTTGLLPNAVLDTDLQDLADGTLSGSLVGTGINATNITTGTLSGSLVGTGISATNITTGTISNAVLDDDLDDLVDGSLTGSKIGTGISASNITTGSLSGSLVGTGIDATNITTGTISNAVLDDDLDDLVDGSLSGSKIGTGISASNITTGSLSGSLVGTGIDAANITTGTISNAVLDDDLDDLVDGSLSGSKVGTGISASNITTGTLPDANLETTIDRTILNASDYITSAGGLNVGGTSDPGNNLMVNNFTQMGTVVPVGSAAGTSMPAIKVVKYTGNLAALQSDPAVVIATGILGNKIISINVLVDYGTDDLIHPGYTDVAGFQFNFSFLNGNLLIKNNNGNSGSIIGRPFKATIIYQE